MADFNVITSDSITLSETFDVLANATRKIITSDNSTLTESIDVLRAGARDITVSDTTPASEYLDIIRANARTVNVSDNSQLLESVTFAIIQSPAQIVRTINLVLTIPATIPFTVTKKDS